MIKIEKIIPGGMALGTGENGKKIFFWNTLPGEMVESFQITKNKSHFSEAIATNIINPSKFRVNPKDDCFLSTSPWQIMDFNYENQLKVELVKETFRQNEIQTTGFWSLRDDGSGMSDEPHDDDATKRKDSKFIWNSEQGSDVLQSIDGREEVSPETSSCISNSQDYFYRNKMEYALYWDNELQKISLAFHQRGSHRKIPITHSSIERPEIFAAATEIVNELNKNHAEARNYQSLILRCNQNGEVSGGLYENHQPHPIFNNLTDKILGQTYSYSPNGFFQINLPVYEMALNEIKKHITTDKVLDLYAGVGTIGLSVARDKKLTLVEVDKFAFTELCNNITIEDISERGKMDNIVQSINFSNIEDISERGKMDNIAQSIYFSSVSSKTANNFTIEDISERGSARISADHPWRRAGRTRVRNSNIIAELAKSEDVTNYIEPDMTVILDPPRAGCDAKLISKLNEINPAKIIYLSCNPATQARDVKNLLENYKIVDIKTFNFFPHTPHIENLIILQRNN